MSISLCPSLGIFHQSFLNGGLPNNAGLLHTYAAGGTTPLATYADSSGTGQANPIVLGADGRIPGELWLTDGLGYRFDLTDALGNLLKSQDNVSNAIGVSTALAASSGSSLVGFIGAESGAVAETLQAKCREIASVQDFGALGAGADESAQIQLALNWIAGGVNRALSFIAGKNYILESPNTLASAANFAIFGNGATLFAKNARSAAAGQEMIWMTSCTDGYFDNLIVDGNRAGRTPANASSFNIFIEDSCARLTFVNVHADNACSDGWDLDSSTPNTLGTLPTDIHLINCGAKNAFRSNLSLINTVRFRDYGGIYNGANGQSPETGIDCEPNVNTTQGNIDARFYDTECSSNNGQGFSNALSNSEVYIFNMTANSNTLGGVQNAGGAMTLDGLMAAHYGNTLTAGGGVVTSTIDAGVSTFRNMIFRDIIVPNSNNACVVTGGANGLATAQIVDGIDAQACRAPLLIGVNYLVACNIRATEYNSGAFGPAIQINQNKSSVRGVMIHQLNTGTATTSSINVLGSDCVVSDVVLQNPGATSGGSLGAVNFAAGALRGQASDIHVYQVGAIPAGQKGLRFVEIPLSIHGVTASAPAGDYTVANVLEVVGGVSGELGSITGVRFRASV